MHHFMQSFSSFLKTCPYHFWATICNTDRTMLSDRCPVLSVTLVYSGQTVGWNKMKLGMQVGLGPGHTVLDGDTAPPTPKAQNPQFSANICCGQMAAWIMMPFVMETDLGPGDFVLDGDSAPSPKRGRSPPPNFRPISIVAKWLDASRCHLVWR